MKATFTLILSLYILPAMGQNLAPNPSFEDVNICTEYTAPCSPSAWIAVSPVVAKMKYLCNGKALQGQHYVALVQEGSNNTDNRMYIQTQLLCPLQKGMAYKVRMYASTDNYPLRAGIRFDTAFIYSESPGCLSVPASMELTERDQVKKLWRLNHAWYILEKTYTATQPATHVIIGNFNALQRKEGDGAKNAGQLYIDSISITPVQPSPACASADSIRNFLYAQHDRHTIPRAAGQGERTMVYTLNGSNSPCDTIILKDDLFLPDRKALNERYRQQINNALKDYRHDKKMRIQLIGHSWQSASGQYNEIASYDKAKAVADYLVYNEGYSFDDFEITGMGKRQPRYDTLEAGGTGNNRVEMVVCRAAARADSVRALKPDTLVIPDILFRFNSSELNGSLFGTLDSMIRKIPRNGSVQLQVTGHTDNTGTSEYNHTLSLKRAAAVAQYLQQHGLENDIRQVSGAGETRPVAGNDTAEGRRRNRRVEIIIYHGSD